VSDSLPVIGALTLAEKAAFTGFSTGCAVVLCLVFGTSADLAVLFGLLFGLGGLGMAQTSRSALAVVARCHPDVSRRSWP
jgi:hypothetical protein